MDKNVTQLKPFTALIIHYWFCNIMLTLSNTKLNEVTVSNARYIFEIKKNLHNPSEMTHNCAYDHPYL